MESSVYTGQIHKSHYYHSWLYRQWALQVMPWSMWYIQHKNIFSFLFLLFHFAMKTTIVSRSNHPGQIVSMYLKKHWRSQKYFAEIIEKSPVEINYIIKWTKDINADFAIRFSIAFGTTPGVRTNLQKKYDLYKASQSNKKNEYDIIEKRVHSIAFA